MLARPPARDRTPPGGYSVSSSPLDLRRPVLNAGMVAGSARLPVLAGLPSPQSRALATTGTCAVTTDYEHCARMCLEPMDKCPLPVYACTMTTMTREDAVNGRWTDTERDWSELGDRAFDGIRWENNDCDGRCCSLAEIITARLEDAL